MAALEIIQESFSIHSGIILGSFWNSFMDLAKSLDNCSGVVWEIPAATFFGFAADMKARSYVEICFDV